MKNLMLLNGRGWHITVNGKDRKCEHFYVCAHSVSDAVRLLKQVQPYYSDSQLRREIDIYWSKNCWGNAMNGITPERGLWVLWSRAREAKPERII
jgi:hypothetical protein